MESAVETVAGMEPVGPADPHVVTLARGTSVGRYILIEPVGHGGMGVVYAAWDPQLDRKVALKLLRPQRSGDSSQGRARLLREAQALGRLNHPNIVTVHDFGTFGDQVFVAMELIDGPSLRAWSRAADRPAREVLAVMLAAGRGLAAAHSRGIVHRDFKPDNVMIDRSGRVVVTDFGLARAVDGGTEREPATPATPVADALAMPAVVATPLGMLTEQGSIVGTPAYLAPEQLVQRSPDARSDQFSFCVAAHEALYGERPFAGESFSELMMSVIEGKVRPEPKGSAVSRHVRGVLLRGLASSPADRFSTMDELLDQLAYDPRRRTTRMVAFAGVIAVVAMIGGGVVVGGRVRREALREDCEREGLALGAPWHGRRDALEAAFSATDVPWAQRSFAQTARWLDPWTAARTAEYTALCERGRIDHELDERVLAAHAACFEDQRQRLTGLVEVLSTPSPAMIAGAAKAAASLSQLEACADPLVVAQHPTPPQDPNAAAAIAEIRGALARASMTAEAGNYAGGAVVARGVLAASTELGWAPLEAEVRLVAASIDSEIGDHVVLLPELKAAYRVATIAGDDLLAARAAIMIQRVLGYHLVRTEEGLAWGEVASAWLERLDRTEGLDAAQLANNTGLIHEARASLDDAETWHRRALELREQALGTEHPETGHSHGNLGNVALARGDHALALEHHRRALAVREAGLGPDHPDVARSLANIGRVFVAQGDVDAALAHFERARAIALQTVGPRYRVVGRVLGSMGEAYRVAGDLAQAESKLRAALDVQLPELGPLHPETAETELDLGDLLAEIGDVEGAVLHLRAGAAALAYRLPPDHPQRVAVDRALAEVCARGGVRACRDAAR